jgi:dihydropteroate synthase
VEAEEEWARLAPVIDALRNENPDGILSVDTRHHEVASMALAAGIDIINDVTGFQDPRMLELASESGCGLIAARARLRGRHISMPDYSDPSPKSSLAAIRELGDTKGRLLDAGIDRERILLDPGFGFGTTFLEDRAIWEALPEIPAALDWPIERFCIGVSRKRFVAKCFGVDGNDLLDEKTAHMHTIAMRIGYMVFRTHSVSW